MMLKSQYLLSPDTVLYSLFSCLYYWYTLFFYKNIFYKNIEQIRIYNVKRLWVFHKKTLQTLNSIFSGNSKHYKIGKFNSKH